MLSGLVEKKVVTETVVVTSTATQTTMTAPLIPGYPIEAIRLDAWRGLAGHSNASPQVGNVSLAATVRAVKDHTAMPVPILQKSPRLVSLVDIVIVRFGLSLQAWRMRPTL